MSDLLVVLNPRRIAECISAIEALPIDKLWLSNYSEAEIQVMWPCVLDACQDFDRLLVLSDDTVPRPHALQAVLELLDEHPVVTGYCNLDARDYRVNICTKPIGPHPAIDAYTWLTLNEVLCSESELIPTCFLGFCLTGMSREMWQRFPYRLHEYGNSADFTLSKRLAAEGIPMLAHRDAFVFHVKETWTKLDEEPRKKLLIGIEEPEMRFDLLRVAA